MKLLVCGGRDYDNYHAVHKVIHALAPDVVIHGAVAGADTIADDVAEWMGITVDDYPANWYPNGVLDRSAGYKRNSQMLTEGEPDFIVAFPGGKGTKMMADIARNAGVPVWGMNK